MASRIAEADVARLTGIDRHGPPRDEGGIDGPLLPAATIVHPRLPGSTYPFGDLSGFGVAFKLAWAVACATGSEKFLQASRFVARRRRLRRVGTSCDVVPLRDENRIFVRHGLERIRTNLSIRLRALLNVIGVKPDGAITAEDVGYKLASCS